MKGRVIQKRRDRRKAKASGYAREPLKAGRVAHHSYERTYFRGAKVPT